LQSDEVELAHFVDLFAHRNGRTGCALSRLAADHEADLCAALTPKEREQLAALGRKIVHQQGLIPDVHPGYRKL